MSVDPQVASSTALSGAAAVTSWLATGLLVLQIIAAGVAIIAGGYAIAVARKKLRS